MSTRKYRNNAEWAEILQQYLQSDLSPIEYCHQQGLDYKYFLKRKRAYESGPQAPSDAAAFIKVKQPQKKITQPSATLILEYQNSQLHISEGADAQWLAQLMKALS